MRKCKCHHLPKEGIFTVGNTYEWVGCIDGKAVIDEKGEYIHFGEIEFLWYFTEISSVSEEHRKFFEEILKNAEPYDEDDPIVYQFDGERDEDRMMALLAKKALEGRL